MFLGAEERFHGRMTPSALLARGSESPMTPALAPAPRGAGLPPGSPGTAGTAEGSPLAPRGLPGSVA